MQTIVSCIWRDPGVTKQYRTAVSLHGHTSHSHESLSFITNMARKIPPLFWLIKKYEIQAKEKSGVRVDLDGGYWTPPLPPLAAFELERNQIESALGMRALVSLTDHDNIEAPMLLRVIPESQLTPVSLEWSVPFRGCEFHLGLHNLPATQAPEIVAQLNAFTASPQQEALHDLLAMLDKIPDVLIVLNHPLWDMVGAGRQHHRIALNAFVAEFSAYLHAFELGGLRPWEENREVVQFAQGWNQLVIAGGDRHGCEPSAVISLTEAESFSEFVYQVRKERRSHVLFLPQYREPLPLRYALNLLDVLRDYPDYRAGLRRWDERVFHADPAGDFRPLGQMWSKPPGFISSFVKAVHFLESAPVRKVLRLALGTQPEPELPPGGNQEVAQ